MSEALKRDNEKSLTRRTLERQRQIDQQIVPRLGRYAVENPTSTEMDSLHTEAQYDDRQRDHTKNGYEFIGNEPFGGHIAPEGHRLVLVKNMANKVGSENVMTDKAFRTTGEHLSGMRAVYVDREANARADAQRSKRAA